MDEHNNSIKTKVGDMAKISIKKIKCIQDFYSNDQINQQPRSLLSSEMTKTLILRSI